MCAFSYAWSLSLSRDKDGGHTIRSARTENPTIHANLLALCFMETVDRSFTLRECAFSTFLLLWPWPWPSINHRPLATSAERRCSGHTWSVTARSCPSGAEGAALVASCSSYTVQGCAFDVNGTWQSLSRVFKRIRSTSQQQPSTSTSSFCQQHRLHCSTDKNCFETENSL